MTRLIAQLDHQTYILGTEIGFYHRMVEKYPDKKFVHLSYRLVCNVFKSIRLENVLDLSRMKRRLFVLIMPLVDNYTRLCQG